jgi:hypothetical protein
MNLRARLERLERLEERDRPALEHEERSWVMEKLLRMFDNYRRAEQGLEPLTLMRTPEEAALEVEDLEHTLEATIPSYRECPGWQSGEGREFLDRWEQEATEKLQRGAP